MTDTVKDKVFLEALLKCLSISKKRIVKDECNDYVVYGKQGKIYAVAPYWYVYYDAVTPRVWNNVKRRLSWMEVQNDGDWEGIFKADFPPSDKQAEVIRKLLKIRMSYQPVSLLKNI